MTAGPTVLLQAQGRRVVHSRDCCAVLAQDVDTMTAAVGGESWRVAHSPWLGRNALSAKRWPFNSIPAALGLPLPLIDTLVIHN